MKKKINYIKIIKSNPLIKEKNFQTAQDLIEERQKTMLPRVGYNIIPPFTTERRLKTSDEINGEDRYSVIHY